MNPEVMSRQPVAVVTARRSFSKGGLRSIAMIAAFEADSATALLLRE
jgi:hypothetical protein